MLLITTLTQYPFLLIFSCLFEHYFLWIIIKPQQLESIQQYILVNTPNIMEDYDYDEQQDEQQSYDLNQGHELDSQEFENDQEPYENEDQAERLWWEEMQDYDEEATQSEWTDFLDEIRQLEQFQLHNMRQTVKKMLLSEDHKQYLREISEKAEVNYYKMELKFNLRVKQIYQYRMSLNARVLFQTIHQVFEKKGFELCEITVKTYVKDLETKQKKYEQKITRMEREIENILQNNYYQQNVYAMPTYKSIPIEQRTYQYIHFVAKLPYGDETKLKQLQSLSFIADFEGNLAYLSVEPNKYENKDYLSVTNNSYCNRLAGWDLGCRVKSDAKETFYAYFQPAGEQWITFSRSMQREEESAIKEICIYNRFESTIVLKTIIKKEQIYLLSYSKNKSDVYIFLTSPPIFEFALLPPNSYCLPNYLNKWERSENFLFSKHRHFKQNDFLRLFLYSNSYMHLKLNHAEKVSCHNICIDIELIQMQLNCKSETLSADIKHSKDSGGLLKLFEPEFIRKALSFIDIPDKPFLTAHVKWKLSYQIMLLIRFNVIGPDDLKDFLFLAEKYSQRIDSFIECLSRKSAGYTNKVAGLNRFRKGVYARLKEKIDHYFKQLDKNLPKSKERKILQQQSCLIYKVSLTPSGILPNPVSPETKCRLIREYEGSTDFFLKVTLQDDVGDNMKNQKYLYDKILRRMLDNVSLLGKKYVPLGWSGSQLRASSLWYVSEIQMEEGSLKPMNQQSILNFLGDFSKIAIPAKKAARIGQAFSSSYHYDSSDITEIIVQDDISQRKFLFTDGIGMISRVLFDDICKKFKTMKMDINCCLQIRYKGAKGVLLVNEELEGRSIVLRESMIKYECRHPAAKKYLDILNWDKYYSGYLNRQIIILLKSLGISDKTFLQFQDKYIRRLNDLDFSELDGNLLQNLAESDDSADSFSITIKSLRKMDITRDLFFQHFLQSIKDTKFSELKKKSRILIDQSARLIGVIDDYKVLREGELYCCIQKKRKEKKQREVIEGDVIITRNPSLSPADVRKCRCLSLQEVGKRLKEAGKGKNYFESFANCIVFPKKGLVPLTAQISGSDLDGDIFFICWEKGFIIKQHQPLQTIDDPNKKKQPQYGGQSYKQMLNFFVDFANSEKLGRINNTHLVHADLAKQYANHPDCKQLAAIHAEAVDYAKSGKAPKDVPYDLIVREYPDFMEKWNKPSYKSESVLGKLFRECKEAISQRRENSKERRLSFSPEIVKHLNLKSIKPARTKEVMEQLAKFEEEVTDLLSHANVRNEFELYAGSSADNEELKNDFGRKRLVDWLQELRERHQSMFFEHQQKEQQRKQIEHYRKLKSHSLRGHKTFETKIYEKAALAYVVSYYCFCNREDQRIEGELSEEMRRFCEKLKKMQSYYKYQGNFLGFVWFIVPKIIISMQNSGEGAPKRKRRERRKKNQSEIQNQSQKAA